MILLELRFQSCLFAELIGGNAVKYAMALDRNGLLLVGVDGVLLAFAQGLKTVSSKYRITPRRLPDIASPHREAFPASPRRSESPCLAGDTPEPFRARRLAGVRGTPGGSCLP